MTGPSSHHTVLVLYGESPMDEHTNTSAPRSRAKTRRFQVASIAENFKLKRRELELTGRLEASS